MQRRNKEGKLKDLEDKNYLFQEVSKIHESEESSVAGLHREFEVLCMKDNEIVDEYFARTLTIANKMAAQEESNDVTTLSIDKLESSLLVHEQRMKITQEEEDEQVLNIASYSYGGIYN
ncbi:hypothetical protein KIW84_030419 [Lathyrus oleraceus]|uniref:Uncharacterized protein n=1 Tax=Pisum sativum TaxID=3888 RepID=A0A9D5AZD9_PEA|nr:hypothetical protein KIW84_030419 [Pisum sativum]